MTTIPEGFEECPLNEATHVVTAGAGLQEFGLHPLPRNHRTTICFGDGCGNNMSEICPGQFKELGIIPVRKIKREPREWTGTLGESGSGSYVVNIGGVGSHRKAP